MKVPPCENKRGISFVPLQLDSSRTRITVRTYSVDGFFRTGNFNIPLEHILINRLDCDTLRGVRLDLGILLRHEHQLASFLEDGQTMIVTRVIRFVA